MKKKYILSLNPDNLTRKQLKKNVKNICAGCKMKFINDVEKYLHNGNFCYACNQEANKFAKNGVKINELKQSLGLN